MGTTIKTFGEDMGRGVDLLAVVLVALHLRKLYVQVINLGTIWVVPFLSRGCWALKPTGVFDISLLGGISPGFWAECVNVSPNSIFGPSPQ